jgi:DNA-binding MarR family transcriptional regulator
MNEIEDVQSCDAYQLIEALMQGSKHIEMQLDAALATVTLSAAKWNALRHLVTAGGQLPLGQLAAKLSCVKSNATQLVDRLEAENLVSRNPDPEDRRSVRAEITDAGRHSYELGLAVVETFERELLEEYSPEERILLRKLLLRLKGSEPTSTEVTSVRR